MTPSIPDATRSPDEAAVARFIHERFVGMFLSQNRRAQLGLLVAATLLAVIWHDAAPGRAPIVWIGAVAAVSLLRYFGTQRFVRAPRAESQTLRVALVLLVNGVLMALPLLAFGALTPLQRAAMSIILLGAATASIATTAGYRAIFIAFALPMLLPLGLAWMLAPQPAGEAIGAAWGIGALVLLYGLFLLSISRQAHAVFEESCRFRYGEQQLNRELTQALDRLGEASRSKTQFLAAASHDLRQPIHSLNVLVAALGLRALDDRSREIVGLLDAVNQSMSRQLDGLLDISRLDAGTVQPTLAPLRLDEFVAAHHAALAPLARQRGLRLLLDAAPEVSAVSDGALLMRVLSNLSDNALKFTPAGGSVTLGVRRDADEAVLSVADSGIGIAADEHERVFREFYQVSNVERDRSKGLGLGLSIVQRLCALLGITLQLDSQPGRGTTFTLRLPAAPAVAPTVAAVPARAALPPGLSVLVIDDEPAVRASMRLLLDELGCTVHLADSSDAARRIAATQRIDVVLSDFRLRDGDSGVVAMRAVRHLHPQVRAALVTGDTAPNRLRDAHWAGVALLHKPVQIDELLQSAAARAAMNADPRFTRGLSELWADQPPGDAFDVVIVGSGYGGSVAAAGLAGCIDPKSGAKLRVAVLERGRHYRPGEFPSRFAELPGHLRIARQASGVVHGHEGLLDVRLGDDVVALVANGLGGGSLINAGVLLEPALGDFENDPTWHRLLSELASNGYFERARRELGGRVRRDGQWVDNTIGRHSDVAARPLQKNEALRGIAKAAPVGAVKDTQISIALDDLQRNSAGVELPRCTLCGDCLTGCNIGAKDSLDVNLLLQAWRRGAELYTGATVVSIAAEGKGEGEGDKRCWLLRVSHTHPGEQAREKELLYVRARHVILAAGSLGSSEILLRSRGAELCLSPRLGERFSCNGDNIAAVHRMADPVHCSAEEDTPGARHVGPTITASFTPDAGLRAFRLQEFAVPAALKRIFDEAVTTAHALHTLSDPDTARHGPTHDPQHDPLAVDPQQMDRTLLVGVIGHDAAAGALRLPRPVRPREGPAATGVVEIHWPDARRAEALDGPHRRLRGLVAQLPGRPKVIANPLWRLLPRTLERLVVQPRGPVLTVHPLGGCGLGADVHHGVVDTEGCVFNAAPRAGRDWQGSLLVLDGAMVPGSLGVNPALTITALAMRAVDALRTRSGWQGGLAFDTDPGAPHARMSRPRVDAPANAPAAHAPPPATEIEVVERLIGEAALDVGARARLHCMVELTLAYRPLPVRNLLQPLRRRVVVNTESRDTRLRIYPRATWEAQHLRVCSDVDRQPFAAFESELSGALDFLHREPSGVWARGLRAFGAFVLNRGTRDFWQEARDWMDQWLDRRERARRVAERLAAQDEGGAGYVRGLIGVASHAGEVRRFDYCLRLGKVLKNDFGPGDKGRLSLPVHVDAIVGDKRLTYNRRANPWQQLTRLTLRRMPGLAARANPVLTLDPGFMAGIGVPLLRLVAQRDQASALADLAAFGLHFARVLLYIHLWTFRKPDPPSTEAPRRLPGVVLGVAPQITELVVDHPRGRKELVTIRLSRYVPAKRRDRPALVMVHGYSVSGNTFTHESLSPSAAGYFLDRGREVWVVDLRTSAALPSATEPWAFEQAALIDLPAALLHVKAVTGRRVDVLAHCIGCAMLGMAILTDASEVARNEQQLGPDTWLTAEHLGLLATFNGAQPQGGDHPCIEHIVLSQKGPLLRYTEANVLRAFLMQSLRRVLLGEEFQFRPPERPGLADQLVDRLLSSLPYPKADYDIENPLWPCSTTGWTTTRHRMDALYGRDFDAANMEPRTLDAIDDLFGPINLDTVAQTAHFARFCMITNQAGRGEFVTRHRLADRWRGIPTLAIHGKDNGLADLDTQRLLRSQFRSAGVPFETKAYTDMGHQDVLIGRQSRRVFDDIDQFLSKPIAPPPRPQVGGEVYEPPWIGPRIELPPATADPLRLAAMPRPDQGRARLGLVAARRCPPGAARRYEPLDQSLAHALGEPGSSGDWLFVTPDLGALAGAEPRASGYFVLLVYDVGETTALEPPLWPQLPQTPAPPQRANAARAMRPIAATAGARFLQMAPAQFQDEADDPLDEVGPPVAANAAPPHALRSPPAASAAQATAAGPPLPSAAPAPPSLRAAVDWLRTQPDTMLARCFVRLGDLQRAEQLRQPQSAQPGFAFAFGSCQYPHGLLDRRLAGASLGLMSATLDETALSLLVGDQIYADATAGLLDATRRDERYDAPHDRALRMPGLRAVMRRVPVLTLPDDHELSDNWEPLSDDAAKARPAAARARAQARHEGLSAFFHYQRMSPHKRPLPAADLALQFAGYPFYLLDTRSRRLPRGAAAAPDRVLIVEDAQWSNLEAWLCAQPADAVKFVASPSLLLPRHRSVAEDARQSPRQDGWGGYPVSLHRLLDFIDQRRIRHTVFLSGDEHYALYCEAWLEPSGIKLVSVHSSALYAPFAFANGRPQDLAADENIAPPRHFRAGLRLRTTFAPPGDGFVRIAVEPASQAMPPTLEITFHNTGAAVRHAVVLA